MAVKETKYEKEKLRENSLKLFGVGMAVFDAAMLNVKGTMFSKEEVKGIINKWLIREVL